MKKTIWTVIRTLLFLAIGLMNTVFVRPENEGKWTNLAGYFFLTLAVVDGYFLLKKYVKYLRG